MKVNADSDRYIGEQEKCTVNQAARSHTKGNGEMSSPYRFVRLYIWKLVEQEQVADQEEGHERGNKGGE